MKNINPLLPYVREDIPGIFNEIDILKKHKTRFLHALNTDGNVYPCNYQACFGSPVYGNALKNSFKSIWEGESRMKIRKQLPNICPAVCDPFKNRANKLFNEIEKTRISYGPSKTEEFIQEIINLY